MAPRHTARPPLGRSLALTFFIAIAAAGTSAQDTSRSPLMIGSGRVSIAGSSNIHEYSASTTVVRITRLQLASGITGRGLWDEIVKPGAIESFEIAIPAASLSSPKADLDKNMHKALKVQEHPDITFRLLRLVAGDGARGTMNAVGMLKIAGVEREVTLGLKTASTDAGLSVKGELTLLMTDYGITPPKAMLGMLKTAPKVTITFETVLTTPLT